MKQTLFILILSFLTGFAFSQKFIVRESDSSEYFVFKKVNKGKAVRYQGSYNILKGQLVDFMTHWDVSAAGDLYWTNGETIYKYVFGRQLSELLIPNIHFTLEFRVVDQFAFIAYNPSKQEGEDDNRYEAGLKFCRIDLRNGKRKYYALPRSINITNLNISPDMHWACFVHAVALSSQKKTTYKFMLYDLEKEKIETIDSAQPSKGSWFGDEYKFNTSLWTDSATLYYYKHTNNNDYGKLLSYDLRSEKIGVKLSHIPERDLDWFGCYQGYLYTSDRSTIYKMRDGIKKKLIFDDGKATIQEAVLY